MWDHVDYLKTVKVVCGERDCFQKKVELTPDRSLLHVYKL